MALTLLVRAGQGQTSRKETPARVVRDAGQTGSDRERVIGA